MTEMKAETSHLKKLDQVERYNLSNKIESLLDGMFSNPALFCSLREHETANVTVACRPSSCQMRFSTEEMIQNRSLSSCVTQESAEAKESMSEELIKE
jgi:hypothetical protein